MAAFVNEFQHELYDLGKDGKLKRKNVPMPKSSEARNAEDASLLEAINLFVQNELKGMGLSEHYIPDADEEANCCIYVSDLEKAEKMVLLIQNQVGSKPGVWSRSLCLSQGLNAGSMLPTVRELLKAGYAVCVLNPNTNSIQTPKGRLPIANSFSPENHALFVWDSLIAPLRLKKIFLLTYGNGSSLAVDIVQRQIVRCAADPGERMRIRAIACVEPSQVVDGGESGGDNDAASKATLKALTLAFEGGEAYPARLLKTEEKLGCPTVAVGTIKNSSSERNVAESISLALPHILRFFAFHPSTNDGTLGNAFLSAEAKRLGQAHHSPSVIEEPQTSSVSMTHKTEQHNGMLNRLMGGLQMKGNSTNKKGVEQHVVSQKLTVSDFDLLRVVGKGAFGKVMLVRKKAHQDEGRIFAMKVLKKSVIAAKGQTEHTRSERAILCEIRHPYIVRLRYAFQSDEKLYLVTDYYNGGSLFYHLRKSRGFSEERARFYGAELVLALDHLHQNGVIYRDLKLENILMDHLGHIALTDFGLSKENVTDVFNSQLTTFCGTAEYIAPELLKGHKYGASVDWWSFGILLYEMMGFRTPFYEKNRKLMFHGIINCEPNFPPHFTQPAKVILRLLLHKDPAERLGTHGADDIKMSEFFSVIDFSLLEKKNLDPPFKPDVTDETDTKYVPKTYLQAKAEDSLDASAKKGDKSDFSGFTFIPDNTMA